MSNAIVSSKNHLIGIKSLKFFSKRVDKIIGANIKKIPWPNNKKFAFTIFDDTDGANLKDNQLVYEYLNELDFKTTKSVWISRSNNDYGQKKGITCEDKSYLNWLLELKNKEFEIGYHNTTSSSSYRKEIEAGLKNLKKLLVIFHMLWLIIFLTGKIFIGVLIVCLVLEN